jgi:uncharacterized protein YidB (DUF937 family)
MGLLDSLLGMATSGSQGSSGGNPMLGAVLSMLQNNQSGGLGGLLQAFHDKGLGDIAKSWVSTGENLPISASDLTKVLGSDQIAALAEKFGLSHGEAASHLSELLPQVVDKLTPNGQLPDSSSLAGMLDNFKKLA